MLTARQILESKGFTINEETIEALESRWKGLQEEKKAISLNYLKENKMGMTNIAGGDKVD